MTGLRIRALRRNLLIFSVLESLFACAGKSQGTAASGATSSGGAQAATCMPGTTQRCEGPGACDGTQVCNAEGKSWGACDCGNGGGQAGSSAGNGGTVGSGGTSGNAPAGGASVVASGGNGGAGPNVGGMAATGGVSAGASNSGGSPAIGERTGAGGASLRCNDAGQCSCLHIAEIGRTGSFGTVSGQSGTTFMQQWLNSTSTAQVDVLDQRVVLTPELLSNYDILILQDLTNVVAYGAPGDYWTYTASEIAAVSDWVQTRGGSIMTLSGYFSDTAFEITPTNQLLQFSAISYNADDILGQTSCSDNLCYCYGNAIPISAWDTTHALSQSLTAVGAYRGRSINAPASASVVATFGSSNVGVAVQVGQGRVFAFADEWVTSKSQWDDSSLSQPAATYNDPYNQCYGKKPSQVFQTSQFWYNVIRWLQPTRSSCFTLNDPAVTPW